MLEEKLIRTKMKSSFTLCWGLLLGIALGGVTVHLYEQNRMPKQSGSVPEQWAFEYLQGNIIKNVNTLTKLRGGKDKDVIELLEGDLSAQVEQLSIAFPEQAIVDSECTRVLKAASRYRVENPFRTGNAERDKTVEAYLSKPEFTLR